MFNFYTVALSSFHSVNSCIFLNCGILLTLISILTMATRMSKNQSLFVALEQEVKKSYLDYAMSVIVGRALPDCRDGLKPVHRRILYAMHELGNTSNKPYKKSARTVGDVLAKYHPHGESSVYDSIVRMAQPFSMGYCLIDGQGNFGSVDGDMAAAMRYTEIRLTPFAQSILEDLDKNTVDFSPNYDGTEQIPDVLPCAVPNFLINGTSGIAVGMATQVPPHNMREVLNAFLAYLDNPASSLDELMKHLPGPDFPTGAEILGRSGIRKAYQTGRGRVILRSVYHQEKIDERHAIVFTEIPYQVNKAKVVEKIAELARDKKIEGIHALRDESDKDGMRIVLELKKDANEELIINLLFQLTPLQQSFSIHMIGLVQGRPELLTLHRIFETFLQHRLDVVTRRIRFDFDKAKHKAHILEGLSIALYNLEAVLELIKNSTSSAEAKEKLCSQPWPATYLNADESLRQALMITHYLPYGLIKSDSQSYQLSLRQAEAILDMKLHKLTSLEQEGLQKDFLDLIAHLEGLRILLDSPAKRLNIIREECLHLLEKDSTPRRTMISDIEDFEFHEEDCIPREQRIITLSVSGYIKSLPLDFFEEQRRGGTGKSSGKLKEDDSLKQVLVAHSHDTLLCFSSMGKVYRVRVYELPNGIKHSAGKPIIHCLNLSEGEEISAMVSVCATDPIGFAFMTTRYGVVKKVELASVAFPRSNGVIAIALDEGDLLDHVFITQGTHEVMLLASHGKSIRFSEDDVRPTGRSSRGVRGMTLPDGHKIVTALGISQQAKANEPMILTASANGYGKCTALEEYRLQSRGGLGILAMNASERNGSLIGGLVVHKGDQAFLLTKFGRTLRTSLESIAISSRNTQGVRLVRLKENDLLKKIERIDKDLFFLDSSESESIEIENTTENEE